MLITLTTKEWIWKKNYNKNNCNKIDGKCINSNKFAIKMDIF